MSKTTARLTTAVNAELAIKTWESESAEQRSLDGEALAHICLGIARAPHERGSAGRQGQDQQRPTSKAAC